MSKLHSFLESLADRRRALGMPWDALGARSGASRATLNRLLQERHSSASFQTVVRVADALGVRFHVSGESMQMEWIPVKELLNHQADRQARKLVGMVQGSMGLEAQAISPAKTKSLIVRMKRRLLAGPKHRLWYD